MRVSDAIENYRRVVHCFFFDGRFLCFTFFTASVYSKPRPMHLEFSHAQSRNSRYTLWIHLSTLAAR
jgi:hypothetical protein